MGLEKPEILVAGSGGMGGLFGAILSQGGLDVTLFDTNAEHIDAINQQGLHIVGFGGDRKVHLPATNDVSTKISADVILFQCKAHGTHIAAQATKHLVDNGAICISFQNGLGNEEAIGEVVGKKNVLGGLTAMAGCLLEPGKVQDFSRVPSYIGEMGGGEASGGASERVEMIAKAFTEAGLETHASPDILRDIWKKLLGNIAMSAISGATNLTVAECLSVPALKTASLRALDEALAVATHSGIALEREEAVAGLELISQAGGTGDNKSSLCVDIINKRPTEVDFIYGSVISIAKGAGIAVPTLETLSSTIKGLESHYVE
ncbi:MAG: ketopantoate reductase family protein [Proteobacteria bacterium]|nr:ketopantoate reductase family protein [Pseudomonadota bacterium]